MEHVHVEVTPAARVEADSTTRQTMLVRALAAGGTLVVSGVVVAGLPGIARSATSPGRDREILDFALQLEYLQKAFYDGAVASAEIDPDAFLRTAVAFEDLAVAAYKGQAPQITSPEVLAAAISIHSVEARHAAWIRYLAGSQPATDAFDKPLSRSAATKIVNDTGFIVSRPQTTSSRKPRYTG